jgi:hypothetical protein
MARSEGVHNREQQALQAGEGTRQRTESARQFDESVNQRELDRAQHVMERQRSERLARDDARRQQNFAPEQTEDPAVALKREQLDLQRQQLAQQGQQFQQSTELEAAKSGLMRAGGQPGTAGRDMAGIDAALQQNPDDPRLQRLRQEMQQGREQMGMGIESTGRSYVPTPEAMQAGTQTRETARMNAQAARDNATIRMRENSRALQGLQAQIDGGSTDPQVRAMFKQHLKEIRKPLDSKINAQVAMSKGKATDKQWGELQSLLDEDVQNGIAGDAHKELQAEVSAREYGPRVKTFLAEQTMDDFVKFVNYAQGHYPEGVIPDQSTEVWQTFSRNSRIAGQLLRSNLNAQFYPIQGSETWKRMVNMHAAFLTRTGKNADKSSLPMQDQTSEPDVMRGAGGQVQEEVQTPGGQTVRRQVNTKPTVGKAPISEDKGPRLSASPNWTPLR